MDVVKYLEKKGCSHPTLEKSPECKVWIKEQASNQAFLDCDADHFEALEEYRLMMQNMIFNCCSA